MDENAIERLSKVESEILAIQERNRRVEFDKAWETSKTRIAAIVIMTYVILSIVFYMIGTQHYFLNAFVPTIGYFLSTLSLPVIKGKWIKLMERSGAK